MACPGDASVAYAAVLDAAEARQGADDAPTCGDCVHCLEDCCDYGVCALELSDAWGQGELDGALGTSPRKVVAWVAGHHKDMQEDRCRSFEEAR